MNLLDIIFNFEENYKHCMLCGTIYDQKWKTKYYKNGVGPLSWEKLGKYKISTGVCKEPQCLEMYEGLRTANRKY